MHLEPLVIDSVLAAVSGLLGWFGKVLWDSVKELRRDLRDLETGIPKEYVRKSDWDRATERVVDEIKAFRAEINMQMARIWERLDGKADKSHTSHD